jgi:hypothetical protein
MEFNQKNMLQMERKAEKAVGGKTMLVLGALCAVLIVGGVFMVMGGGSSKSHAPIVVGKDGKLTDVQTRQVKEMVAKLIVPPQEEPVMAVVTAADSLIKEQAFYQGVTNGDILLIYPQAGKAILYSVAKDRLLNVGPVQVGNDTKRSAPTAPAAEAPKP